LRYYNRNMNRASHAALLVAASLLAPLSLVAQQLPAATPQAPAAHTFIPIPTPTLPPGTLELIKLDGDFADAVAKVGGKAFASWFADDAVTLNNGQPPVHGLAAIVATADWDPKNYKLTWFAQGAQMGPSGDSGFTWGHFDATIIDKDGKSSVHSGRYLTFWKKVNGKWKVALDASANEPIDASAPGAGGAITTQPRPN
jgi:ketosteroid isomerase-like protein